MTVHKNNGDGTFAAAVTVATVGNPYALKIADVDADGDVDILVGATADPYFIENIGLGQFGGAQTLDGSNSNRALAVADFDGDGDKDLAVAADSDSSLYWYRNPLLFIDTDGDGYQLGVDCDDGNAAV